VSYNRSVSTIFRVFNRALQGALLLMLLGAPLAPAEPIDFKVMTRNLYFGADLSPIVAAQNPNELVAAVAGAWANVVASDPQLRMMQVAQEILAERPHIVGLQEAVLWRTQTPGDSFFSPATNVQFGGAFYQLLENALGGLYTVRAVAQNSDAELPGFNPLSSNFLTDYRLTDYDVILVRNDVQVLGADHIFPFAAQSVLTVAGVSAPSALTYSYLDVVVSGVPIRAFNTHLDPIFGVTNNLQGLELIDALNASPYRTVLLGDLNTAPQLGTTQVQQNLLDAGLADAWLDQGTGNGMTWRNDPLLNDPSIPFSERLDYIFHRGFQTLDVDVIGDTPFSDTRPMWPSDHAGVAATLQIVPAPGSLLLVVIGLAGAGLIRRRTRQRSCQGFRSGVQR
jgi:hypothetical protein